MRKGFRISILLLLLASLVLTECKTRKDCGGRRKKKVMTQMGGYM